MIVLIIGNSQEYLEYYIPIALFCNSLGFSDSKTIRQSGVLFKPVRRYIKGRYFSSDKEMEILKNTPERMIVDKLSEVYPARRTARQLEADFKERSDIVKSTIHDRLIKLKKEFFIYELNKQQDLELKNRRVFGALQDLGKKDESSISSKYVLEDVSNSLYPVLPYHLAPGYCHYTDEFQAAWNHLTPIIERELVENLRTNISGLINNILNIVESSRIDEVSNIAPMGMLIENDPIRAKTGLEHFRCANCGIDHESRDFIRAIVLHLLDDFEVSNDFIDLLMRRKIINERGYELFQEANTKSKSNLFNLRKEREQTKTTVERLRIIAIKKHGDETQFLSVDKSCNISSGVVNSVLVGADWGPDSIIECRKSDINRDKSSKLLFDDTRIENSCIKIADEDSSLPRYSELPVTKIKDVTIDGKHYVLSAEVVKGPELIEGVDPDTMEEIPGQVFAKAILKDDTGQIPLVGYWNQPNKLTHLKCGDKIRVIGKAFNMGHPLNYRLIPHPNIRTIEKLSKKGQFV